MVVYGMFFEDESSYIGCSTKSGKSRVHYHEWRARKNLRDGVRVHQKIREMKYKYRYIELGKYSTKSDMLAGEVGFIALFSGDTSLNVSTGGISGGAGVEKRKSTIDATSCSSHFKVYLRKTKKLLYSGSSRKDCETLCGLASSTIHYGIEKANKKPHWNNKYRFILTGGGLSQ